MGIKVYEEFCCGCGLCHSACNAELIKDEKGFYHPDTKRCTKEQADFWANICPAGGRYIKEGKVSTDNVWGKYENVYLGHAIDEEIRYKASSGGVLTGVAVYLLENRLVDGIIHTKFSDDNPTQTMTCISCSKEEMIDRCGSRYAISSPLQNLFEILEKDDKRYAFIGKPCDVVALNGLLQDNKKYRERILYTLSFFCMGIPSEYAQKELLRKLDCTMNSCVELRYRGYGWPGLTTAVDNMGNQHHMLYQDCWGKTLGRDVNLMCKFCMDGIGENADISCGDAWYLTSDHQPSFVEHDGRNVVFGRTEKGNRVLQEAATQGILALEPYVNIGELKDIQKSQYMRRITMQSRIYARRICGKFTPYYDKRVLHKLAKYADKRVLLKEFYGSVKRVIHGNL